MVVVVMVAAGASRPDAVAADKFRTERKIPTYCNRPKKPSFVVLRLRASRA